MRNLKKILSVFAIVLVVILGLPKADAAEISPEFKSILNKDGALEVKSIPLPTEEQFGLIVGDNILSDGTGGKFGLLIDTCNADFTMCEIEKYDDGEKHPVKIVYNYDKNIKKIVDEYVKKIDTKNYFSVKDLEIVNFWINAKGDEVLIKNYSSELKEYFDYKNFEFDIRMGDPGDFVRAAGGEGNIVFDGTIYHLGGFTEIVGEHVLYVPETTGDSKEELIAAIQKRIDDYVGKGVVNITYGGNVYDYHVTLFGEAISEAQQKLNVELAKPANEQDVFEIMDLEDIIERNQRYKQEFIDSWNSKTGYYAFLTQAEGEHYFYATIPSNAGNENVFKFIVVKDDDGMFTPAHITTDAGTNVTISSDDSSIPLDTMINAKELTSGEEYERIIKILNLKDNLTLDLKLYSSSLEDYVTKLEDGTFEVKIPIPDKFKGKDLIVYYVNAKGEKEEHVAVISKDGKYLTFETDHFSIYTLAAIGDTSTSADEKTVGVTTNPDTSDDILLYVFMGIVAIMGLAVTTKKFKREN